MSSHRILLIVRTMDLPGSEDPVLADVFVRLEAVERLEAARDSLGGQ